MKTRAELRRKTEINIGHTIVFIILANLNVGRFGLLKLKVPVLVTRNAVPQSTAQGQAENKVGIFVKKKGGG